jgi:DNA-binding transcriptional LysR family regulator
MVDFKALETAIWVARLESFKAAAEKLHTTQPAISVRIAQLEDELGGQLFDRSNRNVAVTPLGRQVLDYADRLLRLRAEMLDAVANRSGMRGTFRLGVSETIVHTLLPTFLERMSSLYPNLGLEIEVDISTSLRERLLAQKIDLAFLVGPLSDPTILQRALIRLPVGFVANPSLFAADEKISLDTIRQRPILTFVRNTQPYVQVAALFSNTQFPPPRIFASSSMATLVRMALDKIGVAAIPPVIVRSELATHRLMQIDLPSQLDDLQFFAAWLDTPARRTLEDIVAMAKEVADSEAWKMNA